MARPPASERVLPVLQAAWIALGALTVAFSLPLGPDSFAVIALPWAVGIALLSHPRSRARALEGWTAALSRRIGLAGGLLLLLLAFAIASIVTGSAALVVLVWLVAVGTAVAVFGGGERLGGQLAGWALLGFTVGIALFAAEWALLRPSVAAALGTPRELASWQGRYDRLWERNVLGIRSPYETTAKPDGVLRVVALGDSFTWGDKIADSDSTWPAQLERELRRRSPGSAVEVVNLGRNGFTTVNEAEMLSRLGWQFEPDLVVVQFYYNDILPSGPDFLNQPAQWLFPSTRLLPSRFRSSPLGRSALLRTIEGRVGSLLSSRRGPAMARWEVLYHEDAREWKAMVGAIREMGGSAAERGVPAVFMIFPHFVPGDRAVEPLDQAEFMERVARVAEEAGFSVLDLVPVYTREGGDWRRWWATPYDSHPNAAAAGVAARALVDHLETLGFGSRRPR